MDTPKIFESEYRFCQILWEHEPIKSRALAELCAEQLGWKPTTTYTVIKRLSERGVLKNDKRFGGSLPAFLAAFTKSQRLTERELDELQRMIDESRKQANHD